MAGEADLSIGLGLAHYNPDETDANPDENDADLDEIDGYPVEVVIDPDELDADPDDLNEVNSYHVDPTMSKCDHSFASKGPFLTKTGIKTRSSMETILDEDGKPRVIQNFVIEGNGGYFVIYFQFCILYTIYCFLYMTLKN